MLSAQVASLVTGINGAVTLAVFSSTVPGTFAVPRTVPANAVLIAEPNVGGISRQSSRPTSHRQQSCPNTIIPLGKKIKTVESKITPILDRFSKITTPITRIQSKMSEFTSSIARKLRIECLLPKLLRPFEPILKYVRCLLGLNEVDGFMEPPPCNASSCINPTTEDRPITRDRGFPNMDFMIEDQVSTMDDCFDDMEKVVYGSRVRATLVDDASCDDPTYEQICKLLIGENRMVFEEDCKSPG